MGGDSEYDPRASRNGHRIKLAGETPPEEDADPEAAGREEDEPVEFEPDPALMKRIRQTLH